MQWRGCPGSRLERRKQLDVSPSSRYYRLGPSSQVLLQTRDPDYSRVAVGFFLALRERSSQFKSFVVDVFVLPAISDVLLEGPGQKQIYASRPSVFRGCPKFRMLALRLDFR